VRSKKSAVTLLWFLLSLVSGYTSPAPRPGTADLVDYIHSGQQEKVDWCIEEGVELNAFPGNSYSPLQEAIHSGQTETAKLLVENGADVNLEDGMGKTPLMAAIFNEEAGILRYLIEKGADSNHISVNDRRNEVTPLFYAMICGKKGMMEILLEAGADVNNGRHSPFYYSITHTGLSEYAKLMIEYGADLNIAIDGFTATQIITLHGLYELIPLYLDEKADFDVTDHRGWTPLMYLIARGETKLAKLLIDRGVETDTVSETGLTPLLLAETEENLLIIKALKNKRFRNNLKR